MATVYKAFDLRLQRIVALKILHEHLNTQSELQLRFQQEAQLAARIDHPNVVRIYDFGIDADGEMFIVSEFVEGRSLTLALRQYSNRSQSFLHPVLAALVGVEIAKGMEAAHRHSVIHRDLKPDNVLVHQDGLIKLTDFGIARPFDSSMTQAGQFIGSLTYSSPEQINSGKVDARSDIFSFGVILFEMLTGQLPFRSTHPTDLALKISQANVPPLNQIRPSVPFELDGLVRKCLRAAPDERPRSADQIVTELLRYLVSQEVMPGARSIADGFQNPNLFASTIRRGGVNSKGETPASDEKPTTSPEVPQNVEPAPVKPEPETPTPLPDELPQATAPESALELQRHSQPEQRATQRAKEARRPPYAQQPIRRPPPRLPSSRLWTVPLVAVSLFALMAGWLIQERDRVFGWWKEIQQSRLSNQVGNPASNKPQTPVPPPQVTTRTVTPAPSSATLAATPMSVPNSKPTAKKSPAPRPAKNEPAKRSARPVDKPARNEKPVRPSVARPTPKPTSAAMTTQVILRTDPGEMTVYINGVFAGLSSRTGMPRTFEVNAGNVIVRIPAQDNGGRRYRESIRRFRVEAGKIVDLATITLAPVEQKDKEE